LNEELLRIFGCTKKVVLEIQVSLSLILNENEKIKQYIKKKIHKLIVLKF